MMYIRQIFLILGISTFLVLMLGCENYKRTQSLRNYEKFRVFAPSDIYNKRITSEEFLLSLKDSDSQVFEFYIDPHKVPANWVAKPDVIVLSKYLDDSTKCAEVTNINLTSRLHKVYKSNIKEEALKLINIYFTKEYLNFSSENYYSKEKVLEWVKLND